VRSFQYKMNTFFDDKSIDWDQLLSLLIKGYEIDTIRGFQSWKKPANMIIDILSEMPVYT